MRNAHIAIISTPITSHLNLTLPMTAILVRRGYRVTYALSEPFRSRVEKVGVEVVDFRFGAITSQVLNEQLYCRLANHTLADVTPFYEENRPDLIIYDLLALAGRVLAHRWKVPAIKMSPQLAFAKAFFDLQVQDKILRERALKKSHEAGFFLGGHGIAESDFLFHREKLNIHLFSRDFEPCQEAIDETCFYAGRCAGEQLGIGNWSEKAHGDRLVVLVATSMSYMQGPDFFKMFVTAFADLPWHIVLSIDDGADKNMLSPLPSNFEIIQGTSHTKILPHASLLVCMGGIATASEAAYHGVPMIITSLEILELEWAAENVVRLGVGLHLKGANPAAEDLRRSAVAVLESSEIAKSVRELQQRILRDAGAEETANRIGEFLEHSCSR